jgi:hypothetical protein
MQRVTCNVHDTVCSKTALQAKAALKKQKDKEELTRQKAKKEEELKSKQAKASKGERRA